jgi:class 3 adenylate cyclase
MSQNTYTGYLVIGDISGYTSYVATTELEHSQEVLAELLELIVARFQPALTIQRLEGDAVFAHAPAGQISRGETLVECLESTYTAFRDHIRGIVQRTTCECNACRAIPTLDLKFIVHYGDYVVQHVSGISELVGSEVNRLFRLTKNHVIQETGWNAYILYTAASLEQIGVEPEGMHEQVESYEHLGEVTIYVVDLHARFEEISAARYVVLSPEEAHVTFSFDFDAPPPVVWEWLNDPRRRNQVKPQNSWSAVARPGGRTGVGASNHCAHGKNGLSCETILDWRPFEYVTSLTTSDKMPDKLFDMMETISLEPIGDGSETRAQWNSKLQRLPGFVARAMGKGYVKQMIRDNLEPLNQMLQEEYGQAESPPAEPAETIAMAAEGD